MTGSLIKGPLTCHLIWCTVVGNNFVYTTACAQQLFHFVYLGKGEKQAVALKLATIIIQNRPTYSLLIKI